MSDAAAATTVVVTRDLRRMASKLPRLAAVGDGDVVVAGDFNATRDLRESRRRLRDGYRDAAEQVGAGLTRTQPADIWLPPVFAGRPHSAARHDGDVGAHPARRRRRTVPTPRMHPRRFRLRGVFADR